VVDKQCSPKKNISRFSPREWN